MLEAFSESAEASFELAEHHLQMFVLGRVIGAVKMSGIGATVNILVGINRDLLRV